MTSEEISQVLESLKIGTESENDHDKVIDKCIKALLKANENEGWVRIEPGGSNLPTDENETYEVFTKEDMEKAQRENDALDVRYYFENGVISHYKPIVKSQPPIY